MNLRGPELVRDLVSLIQRAEDDEAFQVAFASEHEGQYHQRYPDYRDIDPHPVDHILVIELVFRSARYFGVGSRERICSQAWRLRLARGESFAATFDRSSQKLS